MPVATLPLQGPRAGTRRPKVACALPVHVEAYPCASLLLSDPSAWLPLLPLPSVSLRLSFAASFALDLSEEREAPLRSRRHLRDLPQSRHRTMPHALTFDPQNSPTPPYAPTRLSRRALIVAAIKHTATHCNTLQHTATHYCCGCCATSQGSLDWCEVNVVAHFPQLSQSE